MMKILITGGSGFIGRNLKEQLAGRYEVHAPARDALDLLMPDKVARYVEELHPDVVIHAATWDATRNSKKDPSKILENNLRMFFNVARVRTSFGRLFYIGSGQEYGREYWCPRMNEAYFDVHVPSDQAGFSKYLISRHVEETKGMYNLRCFGVFGKYEDWEIRFISNACCKAAWGLPITIKRNVHFDYLYIDDLVRIIDRFMRHEPKDKVYNVCTGRTYDLVTLAGKVLKASGQDLEIKIAQEGLDREYSGDNARLMREVGDLSFENMDKSIDDLYRWYAAHKDWIDPALLKQDK